MKQNLSTILVFVCGVLLAILGFTKWTDSAALKTANGSIVDFSNRVDSAQTHIAILDGNLFTVSNRLAECSSAALSFSNQLSEAQTIIASQSEQLTNLNQQAAAAAADNQDLSQNFMELTNQLAALSENFTRTEASLNETNQALVQLEKDYGLLSDRFKQNVAARLIMERKFRSPIALREQIDFLKNSPEEVMTVERIYAGLDVMIDSNGLARVITTN